ncbi:MAG TPA: hypothetical protein VK765_01220 [Solirubrobacteraceae bacterium]|nr:hypothetical protein [Solirubrobacteraceae bacterium]
MSAGPFASPPAPPSERGAWLLACALAVLGVAALVAVLAGAIGRTSAPVAPPPVLVRVATPVAGTLVDGADTSAPGVRRAAIVARPTPAQQHADAQSLLDQTQVHISRAWMEGFYPIYATAQSTFGVNWLLIASIHRQESAFSTAPGVYHGLNFAHCCGGPMQFNVTNSGTGIASTWDLVADSYRYGKRPAHYDHMTATHPSVYDDFDAIMAAAHLLSADGAEYALDDSAWWAAYDYYGHDATGVSYADEVLARAIGWSQHGFCINCGVPASLVQAVYAAYGRPVLEALEAEEAAAATKPNTKPKGTVKPKAAVKPKAQTAASPHR